MVMPCGLMFKGFERRCKCPFHLLGKRCRSLTASHWHVKPFHHAKVDGNSTNSVEILTYMSQNLLSISMVCTLNNRDEFSGNSTKGVEMLTNIYQDLGGHSVRFTLKPRETALIRCEMFSVLKIAIVVSLLGMSLLDSTRPAAYCSFSV